MTGETTLDSVLTQLAPAASAPPRIVLSQTGTTRDDPYANPKTPDADELFGTSTSYVKYKKEKPEHRLMLWFRLQGYNVKETAQLTGYTPQSVSEVCKQPWFVEAFCRLAKETGKDAVQTFLEGEVLPALQRTVHLAQHADSDAVRTANNREILDRFLGKSIAKAEVRTTGALDVTVYEASKLEEEYKRNQEILKGRGLGNN